MFVKLCNEKTTQHVPNQIYQLDRHLKGLVVKFFTLTDYIQIPLAYLISFDRPYDTH